MYALNTFLRLVRFLANSIVGLMVGFVLGVLFGSDQLVSQLIEYL